MKLIDAIKERLRPQKHDIKEVVKIHGHQPPEDAAADLITRAVVSINPTTFRARIIDSGRYINGPCVKLAAQAAGDGADHYYIYSELELALYEINPLTAKRSI